MSLHLAFVAIKGVSLDIEAFYQNIHQRKLVKKVQKPRALWKVFETTKESDQIWSLIVWEQNGWTLLSDSSMTCFVDENELFDFFQSTTISFAFEGTSGSYMFSKLDFENGNHRSFVTAMGEIMENNGEPLPEEDGVIDVTDFGEYELEQLAAKLGFDLEVMLSDEDVKTIYTFKNNAQLGI